MKQKSPFSFIIVSSVIIVSSLQCRKEKIPNELPPITQEGKNTFGCKINGQVWVPYYSCRGLSADPCGEIDVNVYKVNNQQQLPVKIDMTLTRESNTFTFFQINTLQNISLFTIGNKADSVRINYLNSNGGTYNNYNYYNKVEKFEITKLDTINKIISGVFEFTLYQSQTD